jgi:hypothetical protein
LFGQWLVAGVARDTRRRLRRTRLRRWGAEPSALLAELVRRNEGEGPMLSERKWGQFDRDGYQALGPVVFRCGTGSAGAADR